jgi:hypothetical protein
MADPKTNLRVAISGDLADIKSALVTLQGQLKGVGATGRAAGAEASSGFEKMRSGLLGLAAGFVSFQALVSGIGAIVKATIDSERATTQLNAKIRSLGHDAIATAPQILELAKNLQALTTFDDDAIVAASTSLLNFVNIDPSNFGRTLKTALDLSVASGEDLNTTIDKLGKALNDTTKAGKALRDTGIALSAQQLDLIDKLEKSGQKAKAQSIILDELEKRYGGAATAARDTLGGALEAAKVAFGNLLEGDSGDDGIRGTVGAVQSLTDTLNSEETKRGFQELIQGLARVATFATNAISTLSQFAGSVQNLFSLTNQKTYDGLLERYSELTDRKALLEQGRDHMGFGRIVETASLIGLGPTLDDVNKELAEVQGRMNAIRGGQGTSAAPGIADDGVTVIHGGAQFGFGIADAAAAAKKAAADAQAKALRDAAEAAKKYEAALKDVDEVLRTEADTQGGPALKAANDFKDIMEKLAAAEAELSKQGKLDAEQQGKLALAREQAFKAYQAQLQTIQQEAEKAQLAKLQSQFSSITGTLNSGSGLLSSQADAGLIPHTQAEEQLQALRAKSLAQLQQLRLATEAYLKTMAPSDPNAAAALQFLQEIDGSIAQVQAQQNQLKANIKDQAVQSLTGFFTDLATGAKSFKDAFLDMVRSFVAGIAQMIAQKLALKAVDELFSAFGWHAGGVVGQGATFVRSGMNPMLFGAAPRYHSGGIAGLAPGEVPAILQRGEEVLSKNNPRNVMNGGGAGGRTIVKTPIVAIGDAAIADALSSAAGTQAILTIVRSNWGGLSQGVDGA